MKINVGVVADCPKDNKPQARNANEREREREREREIGSRIEKSG